jgi:hypothetical protein
MHILIRYRLEYNWQKFVKVFMAWIKESAYISVKQDCREINPRADGAKLRARVLIPPGYLHPGKRKH